MTGKFSANSSVSKRDPFAAALESPKFRQRVVKSRKGKGSYSRKVKSWVE